jgi:hypothetical protein
MRRHLLLLVPFLSALAGCGEAVRDDHFANKVDAAASEPAPVASSAVPVRVGELGPSFAACGAVGTTRNLAEGKGLEVRAAPSDTAARAGEVAAASRFFVCSRSHDQRWLGIVYEPAGQLAPACGVTTPLPSRRNYEGPCRSGWVASAFVKLVAS